MRADYMVLGSRPAFFENVIVNRIDSSKRFTSYLGAGHADSECFFHAYHQFERVNGIQAESIWSEKWQIIADLLRSNLQHQIFDQHFFDLGPQIRLRHNEPRFCCKSRTGSNA